MDFRYHTATAQAAYHDLIRILRDQAMVDVRGKPFLKKVSGHNYWYDQYRLGSKNVFRYIGEDSEDLRARLDCVAEIKAAEKSNGQERRRMVRILRSEGHLPVDLKTGQILTAMAKVGTFRLGGTMIGTQAFRLYEGELGVRISQDAMAVTDDIDFASFERLSVALDDQVDPGLEAVFQELDFGPVPGVGKTADVWKWKQTNQNTLIEFLTPSFEDDEGIKDLPALGVKARALHHLNFLIADPIQVAVLYRSGVLVQIPRPERYAIHKLIIADRRRDGVNSLKSRKDRAQADFLIRFFAQEHPELIAETLEDAQSRGSAWRTRIAASLKRMPETRAILAGLDGITGL